MIKRVWIAAATVCLWCTSCLHDDAYQQSAEMTETLVVESVQVGKESPADTRATTTDLWIDRLAVACLTDDWGYSTDMKALFYKNTTSSSVDFGEWLAWSYSYIWLNGYHAPLCAWYEPRIPSSGSSPSASSYTIDATKIPVSTQKFEENDELVQAVCYAMDLRANAMNNRLKLTMKYAQAKFTLAIKKSAQYKDKVELKKVTFKYKNMRQSATLDISAVSDGTGSAVYPIYNAPSPDTPADEKEQAYYTYNSSSSTPLPEIPSDKAYPSTCLLVSFSFEAASGGSIADEKLQIVLILQIGGTDTDYTGEISASAFQDPKSSSFYWIKLGYAYTLNVNLNSSVKKLQIGDLQLEDWGTSMTIDAGNGSFDEVPSLPGLETPDWTDGGDAEVNGGDFSDTPGKTT